MHQNRRRKNQRHSQEKNCKSRYTLSVKCFRRRQTKHPAASKGARRGRRGREKRARRWSWTTLRGSGNNSSSAHRLRLHVRVYTNVALQLGAPPKAHTHTIIQQYNYTNTNTHTQRELEREWERERNLPESVKNCEVKAPCVKRPLWSFPNGYHRQKINNRSGCFEKSNAWFFGVIDTSWVLSWPSPVLSWAQIKKWVFWKFRRLFFGDNPRMGTYHGPHGSSCENKSKNKK